MRRMNSLNEPYDIKMLISTQVAKNVNIFFSFLLFFLFFFIFFNQTIEMNLAQFNSSIMLVDLIEKLQYKVEKATKYIHTMSPKISLN